MLPFGVKLPVSFYTIHDEGSKFRVLEEMKILGFDFIMKILLHNFFFQFENRHGPSSFVFLQRLAMES